MTIFLPGQLSLIQTESGAPDLAKSLAAAPLKPAKPQEICDIGLFSDDHLQIDLIEMLMEPHP